jgi:UDP-perosamine 4-acetyltransferase
MNLPVIVLGGGAHARVLLDALLGRGARVLGVTEADPSRRSGELLGVPVIGGDEAVLRHRPGEIRLVNGLGAVGAPASRREIFVRFKEQGFSFAAVIHPAAVIARAVELGEGAQVMAGAIVQTGSAIGANSIVNTRAGVDHDCRIAAHVHLAPGATVCGGVSVGEASHVGAGATVVQFVAIGARVVIGAGSLVLRDVPDGVTAYGVPAREVRR